MVLTIYVSVLYSVLVCVIALGAISFSALILIRNSAELGLLLYSVIYWFQGMFFTWVHNLVHSLYVGCTGYRLAGGVFLLDSLSLVFK